VQLLPTGHEQVPASLESEPLPDLVLRARGARSRGILRERPFLARASNRHRSDDGETLGQSRQIDG